MKRWALGQRAQCRPRTQGGSALLGQGQPLIHLFLRFWRFAVRSFWGLWPAPCWGRNRPGQPGLLSMTKGVGWAPTAPTPNPGWISVPWPGSAADSPFPALRTPRRSLLISPLAVARSDPHPAGPTQAPIDQERHWGGPTIARPQGGSAFLSRGQPLIHHGISSRVGCDLTFVQPLTQSVWARFRLKAAPRRLRAHPPQIWNPEPNRQFRPQTRSVSEGTSLTPQTSVLPFIGALLPSQMMRDANPAPQFDSEGYHRIARYATQKTEKNEIAPAGAAAAGLPR